MQASKSIRRLCDLAGLTADEDNNMLYCDDCCSEGSVKWRAGHFSYDFSSGVDFTKMLNQLYSATRRKCHLPCREKKTFFTALPEGAEANQSCPDFVNRERPKIQ